MLRKMLVRARADTFRQLGGWPLIYSIFTIPCVGLVLSYRVEGIGRMNDRLEDWLIVGLTSTVLVFFAQYTWNFICAPYRTERDAHNLTKADLTRLLGQTGGKSLEELWEERDYFTVKETACMLAGVPLSNGDLVGVADATLYDINTKILSGSINVLEPDSLGILPKLYKSSMLFPDMDPMTSIPNCKLSKATVLDLGVKVGSRISSHPRAMQRQE